MYKGLDYADFIHMLLLYHAHTVRIMSGRGHTFHEHCDQVEDGAANGLEAEQR